MTTLTDDELTALLARTFSEHESLATTDGLANAVDRSRRRTSRRRGPWLLATAAAVVVVVGGLGWVTGRPDRPAPPSPAASTSAGLDAARECRGAASGDGGGGGGSGSGPAHARRGGGAPPRGGEERPGQPVGDLLPEPLLVGPGHGRVGERGPRRQPASRSHRCGGCRAGFEEPIDPVRGVGSVRAGARPDDLAHRRGHRSVRRGARPRLCEQHATPGTTRLVVRRWCRGLHRRDDRPGGHHDTRRSSGSNLLTVTDPGLIVQIVSTFNGLYATPAGPGGCSGGQREMFVIHEPTRDVRGRVECSQVFIDDLAVGLDDPQSAFRTALTHALVGLDARPTTVPTR